MIIDFFHLDAMGSIWDHFFTPKLSWSPPSLRQFTFTGGRAVNICHKGRPIVTLIIFDITVVALVDHLKVAVTHHPGHPAGLLSGIEHQGGEGVAGLIQRTLPETAFGKGRLPDMDVDRVVKERATVKILKTRSHFCP
jgi:hypothetical protein